MITAKEILKDKQGIYRKMTYLQLFDLVISLKGQCYFDIARWANKDSNAKIANKLYLRWHYADGRPKPPRVHEVTRLREEIAKLKLERDYERTSYGIMLDKFHKKSDKLIECEWQANLLRSEVLLLEAKNRSILRAAGIAFALVLGLISLQICHYLYQL